MTLKNNASCDRIHRQLWTKEELEIIYRNYNKLNFRQIAELIPTRSFCAVKNKVKKIKFAR